MQLNKIKILFNSGGGEISLTAVKTAYSWFDLAVQLMALLRNDFSKDAL